MGCLRARAASATSLQQSRNVVFVCRGPSCTERGGPGFLEELRTRLEAAGHRRTVRITETGCLYNCPTGPNVLVSREDDIRTCMTAEEAALQAAAARVEPGDAAEVHRISEPTIIRRVANG